MLLPRALDRRARALIRDVRAVVGNLRGVRAPATIHRRPRSYAAIDPARATTAAARELAVVEVRRETRDATTIVLADPAGAPIGFVPGQFFTVLVDVGGEALRRAYSISSSCLEPGTVAITVKRVAGGRVSTYLNEHVRRGDRLHVLGPSGDFTVAPAADRRRRLVLLGGGSGITPLMAIARGVLAVEPDSQVALIYGNRSRADVIFAAELDALRGDRFQVRHVLEQADASSAAGRLDRAVIAAELDALAIDDADYYVCGPEPMMAAARAELEARAIPGARIHEERFSSPQRRAAPSPTTAQPLTVRRGGREQRIVVAPGATLLDAGLDARIAMPFSCAMGGCGACAVTVVDGEVAMEEPSCLSVEERAQGKVLACVARPLGPCTIEVPQ